MPKKLQNVKNILLSPFEFQVLVQCSSYFNNLIRPLLLLGKSHKFVPAPNIYICESLGKVYSLFTIILGVKYWHKRGCYVKVFPSLLKMSSYHMLPNVP